MHWCTAAVILISSPEPIHHSHTSAAQHGPSVYVCIWTSFLDQARKERNRIGLAGDRFQYRRGGNASFVCALFCLGGTLTRRDPWESEGSDVELFHSSFVPSLALARSCLMLPHMLYYFYRVHSLVMVLPQHLVKNSMKILINPCKVNSSSFPQHSAQGPGREAAQLQQTREANVSRLCRV